MNKKTIATVLFFAVLASLLALAHLVDFMGMIKKLHGG